MLHTGVGEVASLYWGCSVTDLENCTPLWSTHTLK